MVSDFHHMRVGRCKILERPEQQIFAKRLTPWKWAVKGDKQKKNQTYQTYMYSSKVNSNVTFKANRWYTSVSAASIWPFLFFVHYFNYLAQCPTPMLNRLLWRPNHSLQFIGAANVSDAHALPLIYILLGRPRPPRFRCPWPLVKWCTTHDLETRKCNKIKLKKYSLKKKLNLYVTQSYFKILPIKTN